MDILVSKKITKEGIVYYRFWSAVKEEGKVYLYSIKSCLTKKYASGEQVVIPTENVSKTERFVLTQIKDKYFIAPGEVIGRYDPNFEYKNTFNCFYKAKSHSKLKYALSSEKNIIKPISTP